jgi:hypothetical protein
MSRSRLHTTAVSLVLLAILAAAAYFTGGFHSIGGPQSRPSDPSSAPRARAATQEPSSTESNWTITEEPAEAGDSAPAQAGSAIGFASRRKLEQHYEKHGAEFGAIALDEYLQRAQALRDQPAGGGVLECVRADGVITRYDRSSGAFLAFDADRTIRTFFRPNDGEAYFHRQCRRGAP